MKLIQVNQKQSFADMRRSGYSIRNAAKQAGISTGTGKKYDKKLRSGELQKEILEGTESMETQLTMRLAQNALQEIEQRGMENLSNKDLIALVSKAPALLKSLDRTGGKGEEDDLDVILREVQQEEEAKKQQQ